MVMLADVSGDGLPAKVLLYGIFLAMIAGFLFLDLFVLNRKAHVIGAGEALRQAGGWFAVAICFCASVFYLYEHRVAGLGEAPPDPALVEQAQKDRVAAGDGPLIGPARTPLDDPYLPNNGKEAVVMFFQGYLLELMLSLDNMMVIAIIMTYFKVPRPYQHRVLFWGIMGAIVLRGAMIYVGSELVSRYHWIIYVFGGFLLLTAIKMMLIKEDDEPDLEKNPMVRLARRLFRITPDYHGQRFIVRTPQGLAITPLMLALFAIEFADVIFAVDSIPAIFGITKDPFIVLTSNCFAILGLRALYFAVAALSARFKYLKTSMMLILAFIGVKMLMPVLANIPAAHGAAGGWDFHISAYASLGVIASLMVAGVVASVWAGSDAPEPADDPPADPPPADPRP
ncbi:MAG: TerC family protein [Phycisphaeraceae bacterium]|nr:MAG: TerC family protein [Phycisphaeraceae bacterium]